MSMQPITTRPRTSRYLGNRDPNNMEVHDLRNEKPSCQIDEIIRAGNAVVFNPDSLAEAHRLGFDNGAHCIGGSHR